MKLVFDAHLDLSLNALDYNRDLRRELDEIRAEEAGLGAVSYTHLTLPAICSV